MQLVKRIEMYKDRKGLERIERAAKEKVKRSGNRKEEERASERSEAENRLTLVARYRISQRIIHLDVRGWRRGGFLIACTVARVAPFPSAHSCPGCIVRSHVIKVLNHRRPCL
jgi:hypothetical protein